MSTRFIDHLIVGVIADRPAATAVPAGTLYSSTDEGLIYQSDGTNWDDWATLGGTETLPGTLLDAKGDIIVASAADTPARLAVGTNGHILTADSTQTTGIKWSAAPSGGILATLIDAKGDLIAGSAADTAARLAVGTDGHVLTADSAQSTGIKWAAPAGGGATIVGDNRTPDAGTSGNVDRVYMHEFTVTGGNLTITALHAMVRGSGNFKLAVYNADDTSGKVIPSTLFCATANIAATGSSYTDHSAAPTATPKTLVNGTRYWIGLHFGNNLVELGRLTTAPRLLVYQTGATFASGLPAAMSATPNYLSGAANMIWVA